MHEFILERATFTELLFQIRRGKLQLPACMCNASELAMVRHLVSRFSGWELQMLIDEACHPCGTCAKPSTCCACKSDPQPDPHPDPIPPRKKDPDPIPPKKKDPDPLPPIPPIPPIPPVLSCPKPVPLPVPKGGNYPKLPGG